MQTKEYYDLINAFVQNTISVEDFESRYLFAVKHDSDMTMGLDVFSVIEDLFEDLDAYSASIMPEDETPFRISEKTLREEAKIALQQLEKFL